MIAVAKSLTSKPHRAPVFPEHSMVRLTETVHAEGVEWPSGLEGAIVSVLEHGAAYLVEFSEPRPAVVFIKPRQLVAV